MLTVGLKTSDGFIDLFRGEFAETDGLLSSVAEGGDGSGRRIVALPYGDGGLTFPDIVVVVGNVLAGWGRAYRRVSDCWPDWHRTNRNSRTPFSKRRAIYYYDYFVIVTEREREIERWEIAIEG